jgi:hypothetical protein
MNKQIKLLGITALVAVIVFSACRTDGGDFTYEGTTTITITGYTGLKGVDIIIPAKINGKSVVSIGDSAFKNSELTGVTIPDSVTSIGKSAFSSNQLTSVTIPGSVTSIEVNAFSYNFMLTEINVSANNPNYCSVDGVLYNKNGSTLIRWPTGKTPVTIPSSVTAIEDSAFYENQLTSITIPDSVTVIGDNAFTMNQLTSVAIPDRVTVIGEQAFFGNQLTSVTLGNSVISIGVDAFYANPRLTAINVSVNNPNFCSVDGVLYNKNGSTLFRWPTGKTPVIIPNSVTVIGNSAFKRCELTNITIPDSVTVIGDNAFWGNQLTSVIIPDNVTAIGRKAFFWNQLTSVTIPNGVTSIEELTFGWNKLTNVTIGDSVTDICYNAFSWYETDVPDHLLVGDSFNINPFFIEYITLTAINVSPNNSNYSSTDGVLYNKNGSTLIRWPMKKTPVAIPDGVTVIGEKAFFLNKLTDITIPDSVTVIRDYAFFLNKLTNVTMPDSVTFIGNRAFSYNRLTKVTIPDSVTSIGDSAFYGNQLTSVTIGANVTIGDDAFFDYRDRNSINNGFETAYNTIYGKTAGTYTRPNTDSTAWTKK